MTVEDRQLEAAAGGVHARVIALAKALPGRGRLLDAPSGAGALGQALTEAGFEVHGLDLVPHADQRLAPDRWQEANLDRGIPFPADHFDVVVSVEGIEHLEAPRAFVRELARVLRPGGRLLISTPNVLNVASRWRFFTRAYHKHFTPDANAHLSSGHLHAIDYVLMRQFLEAAGLRITEVATNRLLKGWRERLFGALIRFTQRNHPFAEALRSDEILFGQILIVVAERPQRDAAHGGAI